MSNSENKYRTIVEDYLTTLAIEKTTMEGKRKTLESFFESFLKKRELPTAKIIMQGVKHGFENERGLFKGCTLSADYILKKIRAVQGLIEYLLENTEVDLLDSPDDRRNYLRRAKKMCQDNKRELFYHFILFNITYDCV